MQEESKQTMNEPCQALGTRAQGNLLTLRLMSRNSIATTPSFECHPTATGRASDSLDMDNAGIVHGGAIIVGANNLQGAPPPGQQQQQQQPDFAVVEQAFAAQAAASAAHAAASAQLSTEIPKFRNWQPVVANNAILDQMRQMHATQQATLQHMQQFQNDIRGVQNDIQAVQNDIRQVQDTQHQMLQRLNRLDETLNETQDRVDQTLDEVQQFRTETYRRQLAT